jgi:hypothetical protein
MKALRENQTMSPEGGKPPRNEAERKLELVAEGKSWLELLDEQKLIGMPITTEDGRQLIAEEFPLIYEESLYMERVHPLYLALKADPNNEQLKSALRQMLYAHLKPPEETA